MFRLAGTAVAAKRGDSYDKKKWEMLLSLGTLVCGSSSEPCTATTTLNHLSASIDRFSAKAISYLNDPFDEEASNFGAFCARVTLENACAALVGRLDSFRMLYIAEFQAQGAYEYGKPTKSGFKWTGDVFIKEKPNAALWSSEHELSNISRALFSPHVDALHWRPAFESAIDYIDTNSIDGFSEIRALESHAFIPYIKGKCGPLYSKLSKGVHWEFFVSSTVMDEGTLKDAIRDCLTIVSNLALVSHFIPTAFRSLKKPDAISDYVEFRGAFQ